MRAQLGLVQVTDGEYRMRANLEIEKELKGKNIIGKIKEED